jgi:hypothetical protein
MDFCTVRAATRTQNVTTTSADTNDKITTNNAFKILTCYTPINSTDVVSLMTEPNQPKATHGADHKLATIPANAIIDMIEYQGQDVFHTKNVFHIGLGQLNHGIMFPLIEGGTTEIANEKVGGCRQFISTDAAGRNSERNIVLYKNNVNVALESPVTSGKLRVDIYYHFKQ